MSSTLHKKVIKWKNTWSFYHGSHHRLLRSVTPLLFCFDRCYVLTLSLYLSQHLLGFFGCFWHSFCFVLGVGHLMKWVKYEKWEICILHWGLTPLVTNCPRFFGLQRRGNFGGGSGNGSRSAWLTPILYLALFSESGTTYEGSIYHYQWSIHIFPDF